MLLVIGHTGARGSRTSYVFVQVAAADAAPFHLDEILIGQRVWDRHVFDAHIPFAVVSCCSHSEDGVLLQLERSTMGQDLYIIVITKSSLWTSFSIDTGEVQSWVGLSASVNFRSGTKRGGPDVLSCALSRRVFTLSGSR